MTELDDIIENQLGELSPEQPPPPEDDGPDDEEDRRADRRYNLLVREYGRAIDIQNRQFDQILRVAAIGFSAAGALFFLVVNEILEMGEWVYWVSPLLLTLLYTIAVYLIYNMVFTGFYTREIEDDLVDLTGIEYLHFTNTFARGMSSFRTGYPPMLASTILFVIFAGGIYLAIVIIGFVQMHIEDVPIWRRVSYVMLHGALSLTLVWSAIGIWTNLHSAYIRWRNVPARDSRRESLKMSAHRTNFFDVISYAILPRPFDFVLKTSFTVGAMLVTTLILGVSSFSTLIGYGALVVLCVEFLAKQATYIWNEILDAPTDRAHPFKRQRLLARLDLLRVGKLLFFTRAAAAFGMAFVVGDELDLPWLLPLVGFIFVWQFIYDRWGKRKPARRVMIAAAGYAVRAAVGALTAMAVIGEYDPLLVALLSAWIVVCMLMVLAEFWWAERSHQWEDVHRGESPSPEPRGIWFLTTGRRVERLANAALVIVGLGLAAVYVGDHADRAAGVTDWIRDRVADLNLDVLDRESSVRSSIREYRGFALVDESRTNSDLAISAGLLAIIGVLLVFVVRARVTCQNRAKWTNGIALSMVVAIAFLPTEFWLVTVAFATPALLAANFEELSLAEIENLNELLKVAPKLALMTVDDILFQPWAVRLSIRPVKNADADDAVKLARNWAKTLHGMYAGWAGVNGLFASPPAGTDGGGEMDVVIKGPRRRWSKLAPETGIHELVLMPPTARGSAKVRVVVQAIGVPAHESMGAGLDLSLKLEPPESPDDAANLRRLYYCSIDNSGFNCLEVVDANTGKRIEAPDGMLADGIIDDLLEAAADSEPAVLTPNVATTAAEAREVRRR